MQLPDSMTKQGVRDLNSLGPQKKRVSTETSKRKDDGQPVAAPKSGSTSASASTPASTSAPVADEAVPTPVPTATPTADPTVLAPGTPNIDG